MFSSSSSDQNSRSQKHTATTATTYLQPSISHRPPTLSTSNSNFSEGHQAATPGAFAAQAFAASPSPHHPSQQQSPDLLHASAQRNRSISAGQSSPTLESGDLRRSHSLNDGNMSNSPAYYQIAAPMAGYAQPQIYGQGPLSPTSESRLPLIRSIAEVARKRLANDLSGYYQSLPAQVPLPSAGYMDHQPRQAMPSMGYYDSPMQYSQSSYPAGYATSYAGNGVISAQSYGSPMQSQQYSRPDQAAALAGAPVQVVDRAKKPQCWEHGCNGREFSTFSNLLRHQREKSGTAAKSYCPHCGAEFTRTTARNGHMEHGKCKTRRAATGSQASS